MAKIVLEIPEDLMESAFKETLRREFRKYINSSMNSLIEEYAKSLLENEDFLDELEGNVRKFIFNTVDNDISERTIKKLSDALLENTDSSFREDLIRILVSHKSFRKSIKSSVDEYLRNLYVSQHVPLDGLN